MLVIPFLTTSLSFALDHGALKAAIERCGSTDDCDGLINLFRSGQFANYLAELNGELIGLSMSDLPSLGFASDDSEEEHLSLDNHRSNVTYTHDGIHDLIDNDIVKPINTLAQQKPEIYKEINDFKEKHSHREESWPVMHWQDIRWIVAKLLKHA